MLFFILATCLQWLLSLSTCDHILTTVYDWKLSATIIELHQYFFIHLCCCRLMAAVNICQHS